MQKRDLRCIILDFVTRRSSPCLLLMKISAKQFRRSARNWGGERVACGWTGRQKRAEIKGTCVCEPPTSNHPDGISLPSSRLFGEHHYQQWAVKRSGTMPLFPNRSRQRHNLSAVSHLAHGSSPQSRDIQSNMFPNTRYQSSHLENSEESLHYFIRGSLSLLEFCRKP